MPNFCLPPDQADRFKRAIIDGTIEPSTLAAMSSAERRAFFAGMFGDGAAVEMNRLLEKKLLLKNQQAGMISWAKKMMEGEKDSGRRNDILKRVEGIKELLNPEQEERFLEDLVSHQWGPTVTREEAQRIADLAAKVDETRTAMESGGERLPYGRAVVDLRNYVGDLTAKANELTLADIRRGPLRSIPRIGQFIADSSKAINASMDNSALFRQGLKVLMSHPGIWIKNAKKSFSDLVTAFGADQVMNEVNADIISRPNYPLMMRAGLEVGINEEMFPTSVPAKIPGVGRAYRASEHAFAAFQRRTRADVFDKYIQIARDNGAPLYGENLQAIGKLVNSLTGRGNLGRFEKSSSHLNVIFFSPRMVKSQIDTLLLHPIGYGVGGVQFNPRKMSFVQKEAIKNLLKYILGIGAILAIAKVLMPDSVDFDPRSANFGKIKIGNTRYDVTGGSGSLVTLAARQITGSSKSSTTGEVSDLTTGKFGQRSREQLFIDYMGNKLSPAASVVRDMLRGRTFEGEKPTVLNEAANLFVPLPVKSAIELQKDPKSANTLLSLIAESLGISVNNYGAQKQ